MTSGLKGVLLRGPNGLCVFLFLPPGPIKGYEHHVRSSAFRQAKVKVQPVAAQHTTKHKSGTRKEAAKRQSKPHDSAAKPKAIAVPDWNSKK